MKDIILRRIRDSYEVKKKLENLVDRIKTAANMVVETYRQNNKVLLCGNGGSAGDTMHIAAELIGKFLSLERPGLPAIALVSNTSLITSISNDFGYEFAFSRQIEALGQEGDILIALSTSGKSPNITQAVKTAGMKNLKIIYLTGADNPDGAEYCDLVIRVPTRNTQRIQEAHILIGHIIVEVVENEIYGVQGSK